MKPRKFFGTSSREVLKQVREAFGADALIVSNTKVAGGIEVIALPSQSIDVLMAGAGKSESARDPVPAVQAAPAGQAASAASAASVAPLGAGHAELTARRREPPPAAVTEPAAPAASAPAEAQQAFSAAFVQSMIAELRSMRSVLEQRLAGLAWSELARRDPARVGALQRLLTAGFSGELARRLTDPMPDGISEPEAMKWLVAEINRNLLTAGADNDIIERGGVYAIMGPTGVGKTTTTAKLAARGVVRHGADRVALLTTDTYRIGAHEQLRIYGRILGVTTSVVRDAAELKAALSDLRGKHMVLIDTIGMSQRDKLVAEQASALTRSGGNVKRLLLLNATGNGDTLEDVVRCYEPGSLDGCILTKLDEAQAIGPALDVVIRNRLALNFVANGQRVPEDLHVPNRQYLIHRALNAALDDSPFALAQDEYPLVLDRALHAVPPEPAPAGRAGAYLG